MSRFIAQADRSQGTLLPESIDEYVTEESPVRVIEALYLMHLDRMDRKETPRDPRKAARLQARIATLKEEMARLKGLKRRMEASPDGQVSLTDPDARSMASQGKGTGIVGYNVQTAVEAKHHLIVAHEVTNVGSDRAHLVKMAEVAREARGTKERTAIADRGYYSSEQLKACDDAGIAPVVPKPTNGGASVRDDQSLDGCHPLLVSATTEGERRDELARPGVQPEASDEDHGTRTTDRGAARLTAPDLSSDRTETGPLGGRTIAAAVSYHTASAGSVPTPTSATVYSRRRQCRVIPRLTRDD